jgi:hypothetical protein
VDDQARTDVARARAFSTDLPALVEDGRLLIFASDADGAWNDFPSRGAFLPLWLQSLRSLSRGTAART